MQKNSAIKHVFISYVREDSTEIDIIKFFLHYYNIKVWVDRESLGGGEKWKAAIRKAIETGAFFIACFSDNYLKKQISYMNEELIIAIEQLRLRPYDRKWFIPVRLSDCEIPARPIGAGETLQDIQFIDFFGNFFNGLAKLVQIIVPIVAPSSHAKVALRWAMKTHIENQIDHFTKYHALRFKEIEHRWRGLLDDRVFGQICEAFAQAYERAMDTSIPNTETLVQIGEAGRIILITVSPTYDQSLLLKSFGCPNASFANSYLDYIVEEKNKSRNLPKWQYRDFVHIIYSEEKAEVKLDMLYLLNIKLYIDTTAFILYKQEKGEQTMPMEQMYPTSIISSSEISELVRVITQQDVATDDRYGGSQIPG